MPLLPITAGTLPNGTCFQSEQARLIGFALQMKTILGNLDSNVVIAPTDPGPSNYGRIWFKTSAGTDYPAGTLFFWFNGKWCSPHPLQPGFISFLDTNVVASATNIGNYDGGIFADALTVLSGPFWEEVSETKGRFPLHPDGGTYVSGATGGEYTHPITIPEIPPHAHRRNPDGFVEDVHLPAGTPGAIAGDYSGGTLAIKQYTNTDVTGGTNDPAHTQSPLSLMPPWFGIALIRRTLRLYRTA